MITPIRFFFFSCWTCWQSTNVHPYKAFLWMQKITFDIPNIAIHRFLADNLTNTSGTAPQWELKHSTLPQQASYAREAFGYACAARVATLANYWLTAEPTCSYISRLSAHSAPRSAPLLLAHPLKVSRAQIHSLDESPCLLWTLQCCLFYRALERLFGIVKKCGVSSRKMILIN